MPCAPRFDGIAGGDDVAELDVGIAVEAGVADFVGLGRAVGIWWGVLGEGEGRRWWWWSSLRFGAGSGDGEIEASGCAEGAEEGETWGLKGLRHCSVCEEVDKR